MTSFKEGNFSFISASNDCPVESPVVITYLIEDVSNLTKSGSLAILRKILVTVKIPCGCGDMQTNLNN